MKLQCMLVVLSVVFCDGIVEEYFSDEDFQDYVTDEVTLSVSTPRQENTTAKSMSIKENTNSSQCNIHDIIRGKNCFNFNASQINERFIVGRRLGDSECTDKNKTLRQTNPDSETFSFKFLYDDDYSYDEVTIRKDLRGKNVETQSVAKDTISNINIINEKGETSEKALIDFFNLKPVEFNLSDGNEQQNAININKYRNDSIWYVPENLPCWDLPILYGELGEKNRLKDVFITFLGKLKSVKENNEKVKFAPQKSNIPISQTLNKWCAADPCYGDHTLCLFPEPTNSIMCMDGYKVSVPTMAERKAIVNTVNSMRNRVASGAIDLYRHLPTAANMNQLMYDFDLQSMAEAWLYQCLPGPSPCSSLDSNFVAQLECTKYTDHCCVKAFMDNAETKCIPRTECFIEPTIGCIYTWFRSAMHELSATDVQCGHIKPTTFNTVQLLWAETNKIGCAYGKSLSGEVRVICKFAPGAPFSITTKSFCGFIAHKELNNDKTELNGAATELSSVLGVIFNPVYSLANLSDINHTISRLNDTLRFTDVDVLSKLYNRKWLRQQLNEHTNGTIGFAARLVTKYTFEDDSGLICDKSLNIYVAGAPGSLCLERGDRFQALCYDFRDPVPGYRLVSVLAPIALFSLILYDLFSGVLRQSNN